MIMITLKHNIFSTKLKYNMAYKTTNIKMILYKQNTYTKRHKNNIHQQTYTG